MAYGSSGGSGDNAPMDEGQRHHAPLSGKDTHFHYNGLEDGRLLIQKCDDCGTLRNPPSPGCGHCSSMEWSAYELKGEGTLFSYTVHHHPPLPNFPAPHPIGLAEFEGVRVLGAMDGTDPADLAIGKRVTIEFVRRGDAAGFRFKLA